MGTVEPRRHPSWVYILPILHLSACLISMVGHVIPNLQSLGIIWVGIMLIDLPVYRIRLSLVERPGNRNLDCCCRHVVVVFPQPGHREIDQQEQDRSRVATLSMIPKAGLPHSSRAFCGRVGLRAD